MNSMTEWRKFALFSRTILTWVTGLVGLLLLVVVALSVTLLWMDTARLESLEATILQVIATEAALVKELDAFVLIPEIGSPPRIEALDALIDQSQQLMGGLREAREGTATMVRVAAIGIAGLILIVMTLILMLRWRLISPLRRLEHLLRRMAIRDYRVEPVDQVGPMLAPVFASYNHLVTRLRRLEEGHRKREQGLLDDVENATATLMRQQAQLARAERLAAISEVAASLAHDLRNPLSSVRAACASLRREIDDADHVHRLDLVLREVDRAVGLLERHLSDVRHKPEPTRTLDVGSQVEDLVALMQYQVPEGIALEADIVDGLRCVLPEDGLRTALMSLIDNSRKALDAASGSIRVSTSLADGMIAISVEDDGPGFDENMLHEGTRSFATTHLGGTGLGLAVAHRFARDLGGRLELANRPEGGARSTLRIPCRYE